MAMRRGVPRLFLGALLILAALCAAPGSRVMDSRTDPTVQAHIDRVVTWLRQRCMERVSAARAWPRGWLRCMSRASAWP